MYNSYYSFLNNSKHVDNKYFEMLKYELDSNIYHFGAHFSHPAIRSGFSNFKRKLGLTLYFALSKAVKVSKHSGATILSNSYHGLNDDLLQLGYNVIRPIHDIRFTERSAGGSRLFKLYLEILTLLNSGNIPTDPTHTLFDIIKEFEFEYSLIISRLNFEGLIVPNDSSFFELMNINLFRIANKPSFIFLHGLPSRYSLLEESKSDYLIVWGRRIKENYINAGFHEEKIFVSGHPFYKDYKLINLQFSAKSVLVVTKGLNGSQYREKNVVGDRGNLITYLLSIKEALKMIGVKSARLRVHPSENYLWYKTFIGDDFFLEDNLVLSDSLKNSDLVIGPTSTVFLDSIIAGTNYIIYEPIFEGIDHSGYPVVEPFDGSNSRIPVAHSFDDLVHNLKTKLVMDSSVALDYIDPSFDLEFLKSIVPIINKNI